MNDPRINEYVTWLARGPNTVARRFNGYITKGIRFHTKEKEESRKSQNSGVVVVSETSTSQDDIEYFGKINDIIELNYYERFRVVLFKCDWVDVERGNGVKKDKFGYTLVNFSRLVHTRVHLSDEPFVFTSQVEQVFYIQDAIQSDWNVVVRVKPRDTYAIGDELSLEMHNGNLNLSEDTRHVEDDFEDVNWVRNDIQGRTVTTAQIHTNEENEE
ncbi:hypothetical protein LINPERHAP2_LOCUS14509 [Linum perenne]